MDCTLSACAILARGGGRGRGTVAFVLWIDGCVVLAVGSGDAVCCGVMDVRGW